MNRSKNFFFDSGFSVLVSLVKHRSFFFVWHTGIMQGFEMRAEEVIMKEKGMMQSRILTGESGHHGSPLFVFIMTWLPKKEIAQETHHRWRFDSMDSLSPPTFTHCQATSRMWVFLNDVYSVPKFDLKKNKKNICWWNEDLKKWKSSMQSFHIISFCYLAPVTRESIMLHAWIKREP